MHTVNPVSPGNPFSAGLRAARVNLVPGIVIQILMAAVVLCYYFLAPAKGCFQYLADAKAEWGYGFSFVASVLGGAVLPIAIKGLTLQRGRFTRGDLAELLFLMCFWGVDGVIIDGFYRLQAVVFGGHADFWTVCKKVLVDQFIYNPLFAAPYTLAWFELKNRGYRWREMAHVFTAEFYRDHTVPALFATWAVWIPVTSAIYALPSLLQIPLFALALSFWTLLVLSITALHRADGQIAAALAQVAPD